MQVDTAQEITATGEALVLPAGSDRTENETLRAKAGPPLGNQNGFRHGLDANRRGLTDGFLPRGCAYIRRQATSYRAAVEAVVIDQRGAIDILDASTIDTAVKWQTHSLLARRWLRLECATMTPADRLNFSREVARGAAERDKAIDKLGLKRAAERSMWDEDVIDAQQASTSTTGNDEG